MVCDNEFRSEIGIQPARGLRRKDTGRSSALLLASTAAAAQGLHQGRVQSAVMDFTVEPMTSSDSERKEGRMENCVWHS